MDNEIQAKLVQYLDTLATKLGTTTEALIKVLIKQGYISGIISGVKIIGAYFLKYFVSFLIMSLNNPKWDLPFSFEALLWVSYAILIICVIYQELPNLIVCIGNPEFWAFDYITNKFG